MTDPIADLLTRIRNAGMAGKEKVECPKSNMKIRLLDILVKEGYIKGYKVVSGERHESISITLRFLPDRQPVILGLRRISKPGLRQYVRHDRIPRIRNGLGTAIISTSRGVMSDRDARRLHIGGELVCVVW